MGISIRRQILNADILTFLRRMPPLEGRVLNYGGHRNERKNVFLDELHHAEMISVNIKGDCDYRVADDSWKQAYDHVFAVEVVEYFSDPEQLVTVLDEWLKPGGLMILSGPWLASSHIEDGERSRPSLSLMLEILAERRMEIVFATEQGGAATACLDLVVSCMPSRVRTLVRLVLNALWSPFLAVGRADAVPRHGNCTGWLVVGRKV